MLTVEIKRELPYRFIRWKTIGNIYHNYRAPITIGLQFIHPGVAMGGSLVRNTG